MQLGISMGGSEIHTYMSLHSYPRPMEMQTHTPVIRKLSLSFRKRFEPRGVKKNGQSGSQQ